MLRCYQKWLDNKNEMILKLTWYQDWHDTKNYLILKMKWDDTINVIGIISSMLSSHFWYNLIFGIISFFVSPHLCQFWYHVNLGIMSILGIISFLISRWDDTKNEIMIPKLSDFITKMTWCHNWHDIKIDKIPKIIWYQKWNEMIP
jgi:hypothetical protein